MVKRNNNKRYHRKAFVPEWSKGADLSSAIERCVGSNPTGCILQKKMKGQGS